MGIGILPNARIRMRLLHFENAFGAAYNSEYCLDAMLSLVLLMARNARPNADRLTRLIGPARRLHVCDDGHNDRVAIENAPEKAAQ